MDIIKTYLPFTIAAVVAVVLVMVVDAQLEKYKAKRAAQTTETPS